MFFIAKYKLTHQMIKKITHKKEGDKNSVHVLLLRFVMEFVIISGVELRSHRNYDCALRSRSHCRRSLAAGRKLEDRRRTSVTIPFTSFYYFQMTSLYII